MRSRCLFLILKRHIFGPEVVNSWVFYICRTYPSIPYRLIKYALENSSYLQYLQLNCCNTHYNIRLSSHDEVYHFESGKRCDLSIASQEAIKKIHFESFPPTKDYLDLLSNFLPNIGTIICTDEGYGSVHNDARKSTSFTFNLTAFQNLKSFHMNIETVVDFRTEKAFDNILVHFKFADGDEAFYSIRGETGSYSLTPATQQFIKDCTQNKDLSTKLLTFECSKIEKFTIYYREFIERWVGAFRFGVLKLLFLKNAELFIAAYSK